MLLEFRHFLERLGDVQNLYILRNCRWLENRLKKRMLEFSKSMGVKVIWTMSEEKQIFFQGRLTYSNQVEEVPLKWMDRPSATDMDRGCASEMDRRKSERKKWKCH